MLQVSIEFIRLGQSVMINFDPGMFDFATQMYAMARTTTLTDELGRVDYIFSDKTGTLTQNVMVFQQCVINDQV